MAHKQSYMLTQRMKLYMIFTQKPCMLAEKFFMNFSRLLIFSKSTFSKHSFRNISVSNSFDPGSRFCLAWSGSEGFEKVISRRQKLSLKE